MTLHDTPQKSLYKLTNKLQRTTLIVKSPGH